MLTTVGAISAALPTPGAAKTEHEFSPAQVEPRKGSSVQPDAGMEAMVPVPLQPLSSRMLATFMQEDIELYGSMFST
jgi:hypothetical protein